MRERAVHGEESGRGRVAQKQQVFCGGDRAGVRSRGLGLFVLWL